MRPSPILCRNCRWRCFVDKRLWRKVVCVNKLCGAKLLVEVNASHDLGAVTQDPSHPSIPLELTLCPTCHGPVRVREHLWQKATCINSKCRTKFLIQASEEHAAISHGPVEIIMPPERPTEPVVLELTPTPPTIRRVVTPVIVDPNHVVRKRSRRRLSRRQLFVCVLAFIPCLVLMVVISATDNDVSRWASSVLKRCTESLWEPVDPPGQGRRLMPPAGPGNLLKNCQTGSLAK